jgi:hypothetical protein
MSGMSGYAGYTVAFYNEACARCGLPRDIHLEPNDPPVTSLHSIWGNRDKCRNFTRSNPPKPAYGEAWWQEEGTPHYSSINNRVDHYPIKYYYERACSISWICNCGTHNKHQPLAQGTVYEFFCINDI